MLPYLLLVLAVAFERGVELLLSKRNIEWAKAHGGIEHGFGHYRFMVVLHSGLLIACLVEASYRTFSPALGWSMLVLVVLAQALRWWCITVLGRRWNTRVVVVPGLALVRRGPYRWVRHPNYVAVVIEGFALPLVHSAWITAAAFTVVNAGLLVVRIRCENAALGLGAPQLSPSR